MLKLVSLETNRLVVYRAFGVAAAIGTSENVYQTIRKLPYLSTAPTLCQSDSTIIRHPCLKTSGGQGLAAVSVSVAWKPFMLSRIRQIMNGMATEHLSHETHGHRSIYPK